MSLVNWSPPSGTLKQVRRVPHTQPPGWTPAPAEHLPTDPHPIWVPSWLGRNPPVLMGVHVCDRGWDGVAVGVLRLAQ